MSDDKSAIQNVFISYSWSNPDHESWVITFAEELVSQGIHVILDKWDLQPGHDANAFMESMVTDPSVSKVILVCDQKYADKSNRRAGGAGTEAQIITPELYEKKDQDKFVAVVRELDAEGKVYLPVYYGSRIYIDLTNPSTYGTEFDRLVQWIYGQPLYIRPKIGLKPSFLSDNDESGKIDSAVLFRRASEAVKNNQTNAVALVNEYFLTIATGMEAFRVNGLPENLKEFDDVVVESIVDFIKYRNEIIEIFSAIAQYACTEDMLRAVHHFFEKIIPYTDRPAHINSWNEWDFDNFKFILHELFLYAIAIFIKNERFDAASYFIDNEYFWENPSGNNNKMHNYIIFREHLRILDFRNRRLNLNRLSLRADMLKERCKNTAVGFNHIMAADLILYLRSRNSSVWHMWWPETLIYTSHFGTAFELFARAKSTRYFERIKGLLGVQNTQEFKLLIEKLHSEPDRIPKWQFERIDPARLVGLDAIATTP